MQKTEPRGVEHLGITVPDHDAAVRFFKDAFGATILFSLVKPGDLPVGSSEVGPRNGLADGTAIKAVSMLRLANGPNIEIFEIDRPRRTGPSGISDHGISHFSLTVEDMEAVTGRFVEAGGTLLEGPYDLTGQEEGAGNRGRFGRTPWGLLIEFESFASSTRTDEGASQRRWFPPLSGGA